MIRIGIVGCGRILAAHLRGYRRLREAGVDDFRITALCARRPEDAQMYVRRGEGPAQRRPVSKGADPLAAGDEYLSDFQSVDDVRIFTDYRQMMQEAAIEGVNDLTTHALHHQVAEAAIACGKHVLTQKPLAVSMAAGRRMLRLAEEQGVVLGVFENARFRPDTRWLGWLFESGQIGRLQLVLMTSIGHWWAPDRIVAETPWRHRHIEGGGLALDIGVHLFHHLRYVAGEIDTVSASTPVLQPERVTRNAQGEITEQITADAEDTLAAQFRTERNVLGNLCCSWTGHGRPTRLPSGRGLIYYSDRGSATDENAFSDDGKTQPLEDLYAAHCPVAGREREFPLGLTDGFALNQLDWLEAVRELRAPETSGEEGLRDLAAAFALLESDRAARTIRVADVLQGAVREAQAAIDKRFALQDE